MYESGEEVSLRVAGAPIVLAMDAGTVDLEEWGRRGIDVPEDRTNTLAEEKFLTCPDIDTALWLLRQPPVMAAARMLNAWVAAGPFPFESRYRAEIVGRAWQAAETLLVDAASAKTGGERGFDREYAVSPDLPSRRAESLRRRPGRIEMHGPDICGDNHVIVLPGQGTPEWTAALTKGRQPDVGVTRRAPPPPIVRRAR
ncbi:hypothetical protein SAMN04489832_1908 [Micromonospora cremea]|uniref:Uncharacterized protein n=1 Tax=Micromonospora cremea TaxID=709881 RepID=A0A1N5VXX4_9ACTN|nr:hypothetical protein SAMN04489832_1908 [Micromonospora cremea]